MKTVIFLFFIGIFHLNLTGSDLSPINNNLYSTSLICPDATFYLTYDQPTQRYLVLLKDGFYYLNKDSLKWIKTPYLTNEFNADLDFKLIKILNTASRTFLVLWSGGYVYELKGNSIYRVDKSFNQRSQLGSTKYMVGDTIVSYGGYGFWNYQNFFTYFSPSTKEWELFELSSDHPLPKPRSYQASFYNTSTQDFFIWLGQSSKYKTKEPFEMIFPNDVWKINMVKRKWVRLGTFNKKLPILNWFPIINSNNKCLVLFDVSIFEIDFYKNKVTTIEIDKNSGNYIQTKYGVGFNPDDNEIIFVRSGNGTKGNEIRISAVDSFFSENKSETYLYSNPWKYFKIGVLIVALCLFAYFVYWWRKKYSYRSNMLVLHSGSGKLTFKNININLDDDEKKLLVELSKEERYFNTVELFEIISEGQYSPDLLKKQKMKIMNSINKKIDFVSHGENDLFLTRKNPNDKRLVEIKLNDKIIRIIP